MTSYKELGLVNTREMFAKAVKGGYAIPAFNFNTLEQMQAIVQAATLWLSLSVPAMVHTSSLPSSAHATPRQVSWCLLHWHLTSCMR